MRAHCSRSGSGTVYERRRKAARFQCVNLIFHQGNQRRDDDGGAAEHHGRQLVTERLAAAGGHDDDGVFAVENGRDHFALPFAEVGKSKVFAQRVTGIGNRMHARESKRWKLS